MITPSFGLTATERVLPRLALDWTTGLAQPGVDVTRAGVATFVGSNGLIQPASADTQRIDYSTGTAGLLVEESRTNLLAYSEDFSDASWLKFDATITSNAIVAPDGNLTADKFVATTGTTVHRVYRSAGSAAAHTLSAFLKAGEYTWAVLRIEGVNTFFNLSAGTIGTNGAGNTASITSVGNGWYKCSITRTIIGATASVIGLATADNTDSFTGDDASGIYIWGAQLEAGAFPTSYIPTEATAVTRNADVATMTGTNFSDWFNASEGAIVCTYDTAMPSGTGYAYGISNGLLSAFIGGNITTGNAGVRVDNTTNQVNLLVAPYTVNTQIKTCLGYKANSFAGAGNGLAVLTDTAGTIPTVDRMHIGSLNGVVHINGHIAKLAYYPQRIINAEVQAFSKV